MAKLVIVAETLEPLDGDTLHGVGYHIADDGETLTRCGVTILPADAIQWGEPETIEWRDVPAAVTTILVEDSRW